MRLFNIPALILITSVVMVSGCSITQSVDPVHETQISNVCVQKNAKVMMGEFEPEVRRQIEAKGIRTSTYSGNRPYNCRHSLEYTANWQWDLAMYLSFAELRVYEDSQLAGKAVYDARRGGGRMDKFGTTAAKIEPLIDELFDSVEVVSAGHVPSKPSVAPVADAPRNTAERLRELQYLHDESLITDAEYEKMKQEILKDI